jgi:hypothetical protein
MLVILLLVIADSMRRAAGGAFVGFLALVSAVAFVASFVPRFRPKFAKALVREKLIDPLTGRPLGMVWWYRWFTATLAVLLFIGLGDYAERPSQTTPPPTSAAPVASSAAAEPKAPPLALTAQQVRDARLVLCDAVEDEMDTVSRGEHAKNALVLADQMRPGAGPSDCARSGRSTTPTLPVSGAMRIAPLCTPPRPPPTSSATDIR